MAEKEDGKWGIRIRRKAIDKTHGQFEYELFLAPFKKGDWFVSNPALRQAIKDKQLYRRERRLGHVVFRTREDAKWVYAEKFTPFGYQKAFQGKGLGSLVEMQLVKDLIQTLGRQAREYRFYVGLRMPGKRRLQQYRERGLYTGQLVPLPDYLELIVEQVKAGVKKARAKRPARKPSKPKKEKPAARQRRK